MSQDSGAVIIEVVLALLILAVLALAIFGLATLSTRVLIESKRQTVAQGLAQKQLEEIRSYAYTDIGYTTPSPGESDGVLPRTQSITQNGQAYTLTVTVELVDDSINGANALTEAAADYKRVTSAVAWATASGTVRSISLTTLAAPPGVVWLHLLGHALFA